MKKHIFNTTNWVYGFFISLLGFSQGCSVFGGSTVMYDPVHPEPEGVRQVIKGTVTDKSGNPIPNISVKAMVNKNIELRGGTMQDGYFILDYNAEIGEKVNYVITFRDTDGEENGLFKPQTQTMEIQAIEETVKELNVILEDAAE